tara:strand:- start:798 stop:2000 length:1203 start_codon:yes stop_codon:yes gene_type:complete
MKQIERYIFSRIATLFFWVLASTTILSLTTQILIRVDVLTTSSSAIVTFLSLAATLVPQMVLVVAPFALMIGIGRVLTTMNEDSELVVIEASGASGYSIAKPVIFVSTLVGFLLFIVANLLSPRATQALYSIISGANSDVLSLAVSSGSFQRIEDDLYIQVSESLANGEMGGLFVSDRRDPSAELVYFAKSATLRSSGDTELLLMQNGQIHRSDRDSQNISIIEFTTYVLDLNSFIPTTSDEGKRHNELYLNELLFPDTTNPRYEAYKRLFPFEINSRLSGWLYPIAFGFVMVAFLGKAQSHRNEQYQRIATAALICLALRLSGSVALDSSEKSVMGGILAYALPILVGSYFAFIMAQGGAIRLPKIWLRAGDYVQALLGRINERLNGSVKNASEKEGQP